jgi:hypothetical protein
VTTSPTQTTTRELVRRIVRDTRDVLEATMADVTQDQLHVVPPGVANPLGATYAHAVCSEDVVVQGMLRQATPLLASTWAGRTGLSEPMPTPGTPAWADYAAWARRVRIDLVELRGYAQAVAEQTDAWLAGLTEADLDQPKDMSAVGLGQHTLASAVALLVAHHLATETGEIAVLKGLQGTRGYPR